MLYETEPRSVLLTHDSDDLFGVSGILVAPNWVLTHGSMLASGFYDATDHAIRDFLVDVQMDLEKDLIGVPVTLAESLKLRLQYSLHVDRISQENIVEEKKCMLRAVWRCPLLRRTFNDLLFSWSFDRTAKYDKSLLPIFLLLQVNDGIAPLTDFVAEAKQTLRKFYTDNLESSVDRPIRGTPVEIESSAFGSIAFLDSLSQGIVSNSLGDFNCVVLSDASTAPGSEGAPLFLHCPSKKRLIYGITLATMSWCNGERVDFTFAANLRVCLRKILNITAKSDKVDPLPIFRTLFLSDSLDESLVVVRSVTDWGTGIVVDSVNGVIVTCSHVVSESLGSRIKVKLAGNIDTLARLIYKTKDGQPYDVAVLKLERSWERLKALEIATRVPEKGAEVMTAGFSFWQSAQASFSRGVISRSTGCILQTTCCVQSGSSGGPVIDCRTGQLLGLIVSNVISSPVAHDNPTLYTRFNMAVPAGVLRQPLMEYIRTRDVQCLEILTSNDSMVQETWNFYLKPRSKL